MYNNGLIKVEAATPRIIAGNINNNEKVILKVLNQSKAGLIVFPELSLTGYSASDLFFNKDFYNEVLESLKNILENNNHKGLAAIGMPLLVNDVLFNVGVVIKGSNILGVVPKFYLPNHLEYNEKRWFIEGTKANFNQVELLGKTVPFGKIIFREKSKDIKVGIEVCQDMWSIYPPSNELALMGANVILNLSASSELLGKGEQRRAIVLNNSLKQVGAYVYTTTGFLESSSEHLFTSHKIIASLGEILNESNTTDVDFESLVSDINISKIIKKRKLDSNFRDNVFKNSDEYKIVDFELNVDTNFKLGALNKLPFVPMPQDLNQVSEILVLSLYRKILSLPKHLRKVIIGMSGGLDSTNALLVAYLTFTKFNLPLKDLIVVSMPSTNSSEASVSDSELITNELGLELIKINIDESVKVHLEAIKHDSLDVTYENAQARIRTLILMDLANKYGGIVLGTGDLSEIALGFMTYNGDQMSMYAINSGIPKTLIKAIVSYYANNDFKEIKNVLLKIVNKVISPELLKNQSSESIIGSYEVNDFIMYHYFISGMERESIVWLVKETFNLSDSEANTYVERFLKLFYQNQFKRQTLPEGPKVFAISFSPRSTFRLPSDIERVWFKWKRKKW